MALNRDSRGRSRRIETSMKNIQITVINGQLTTEDLAAYLQVSASTLRAWRGSNEGPRFFRAGRNIRYRLDEVEAWIERNSRKERRRVA